MAWRRNGPTTEPSIHRHIRRLPSHLLMLSAAVLAFLGAAMPQGGGLLAKEAKPDWLGSREGITDEVLPPWTPLRVEPLAAESAGGSAGVAISCWGRTYRFAGAIFPTAVETDGRELLTGPMRLLARVIGEPEEWKAQPIAVAEQTPARVCLTQVVAGKHLSITANTQVEYDGAIRIDWELRPHGPLRLEELTLEIPLKAEHASLLYYYPNYAKSWSEHRPRALGDAGFVDGFLPVISLGDEERGLMWFCESDEHWLSDSPDQAVEIRREGDTVAMRLRIVDKPVALSPAGQKGASLHYTFGLLATPVKPVVEDAWDYRTFHISQSTFGVGTRLKVSDADLDRLAALGVKTVAFHEHWTDIESYTETAYGDDLRSLVARCHARGIKLLLYFGFLMSDKAAEWEEYSDDCLLEPRSGYFGYNYPPQPIQNALIVCYRSVWQDFLVHGIGRVMDEYDIDGVYLDGTSTPFGGCKNQRHGCGYVRPDGTVAPTYALFPIRETLRRIYTVVRSRKPDGQVNVHQSAFMTNALPYFTSYWDGEHLSAAEGETATGRLSLDMFRAEFMGHQWGVPAEFLHSSSLGLTYWQACGLSVLHDVPTRPVSVDQLEQVSRLWRVFDEFGRKEAEWLPYWRNPGCVAVEPEGCRVSLYRHPTRGVLAVVFNASGREQEARVAFDLPALGLNAANVEDAFTGENVAMQDVTVQLRLAYLDWRLLWLRPPASGE